MNNVLINAPPIAPTTGTACAAVIIFVVSCSYSTGTAGSTGSSSRSESISANTGSAVAPICRP